MSELQVFSEGSTVCRPNLPNAVTQVANPIPWNERLSAKSSGTYAAKLPPAFRPILSRVFWWKVLYALRAAGIGTLIPAALIAAPETKIAFLSTVFATLAALFGSRETFGGAIHTMHEMVKAAVVVVPLMTFYIGVRIYADWYAWSCVYIASIILMFYLYDGLAKRIAVLLMNAMLVSQLMAYHDHRGPATKLVFPIRLIAEFALGALAGLISTLIPYPSMAWRRIDKKHRQAAENISVCFAGLCDSFFAESNMQRRLNLVHIHFAQKCLAHNIEDLQANMFVTKYEPQTLDGYYLRQAKTQLLCILSPLIDSTLRVLETLCEDPSVVDDEPHADAIGSRMAAPIKELADAVEAALTFLLETSDRIKILDVNCAQIARVRRAVADIDKMYSDAREELVCGLSDETRLANDGGKISIPKITPSSCEDHDQQQPHRHTVVDLSDFHNGGFGVNPSAAKFAPAMAFYMFTLSQFAKKLSAFPNLVEERRRGKTFVGVIVEELWRPFADTLWSGVELLAVFVPSAFPSVSVDDARFAFGKLMAGCKLALAMGLSMLFYYHTDRRYAFLNGPQVLCFVMAATSAEAVQGSANRLLGTLFGTAVGFFFAQHTTTPIEKVAVLCTVTFFFSFFRTGKQYGGAALYAGIVVIPMLGPTMTMTEAMSRFIQLTWAVIFYNGVMFVVYPPKPSIELLATRLRGLAAIGNSFTAIMDAVRGAGSLYSTVSTMQKRRLFDDVKAERKDEVEVVAEMTTFDDNDTDAEDDSGRVCTHHHVANEPFGVAESPSICDTADPSSNPFVITPPQPLPYIAVDPQDRRDAHAADARVLNEVPSRQSTASGVNDTSRIHREELTSLLASGNINPDALFATAAATIRALDALIAKTTSWLMVAEIDLQVSRFDYPAPDHREHQTIVKRIRSALELMVEALKVLRTSCSPSQHGVAVNPYLTATLAEICPMAEGCAEAFAPVVRLLPGKLSPESISDDTDAIGAYSSIGELVTAAVRFEQQCAAMNAAKSLCMSGIDNLSRFVTIAESSPSKRSATWRSSVPATSSLPTMSAKPMAQWACEDWSALADLVIAVRDKRFRATGSAMLPGMPPAATKMLVANADAEAIHTFCYCLVIFSCEVKKLILNVEVLHLRSTASLLE